MEIAIASKGRAGKTKSAEFFEDCVLYVPEYEAESYLRFNKNVIPAATHTNYTLYGNFLNSSDSTNVFLIRRKLEGYTDTVTSASKWFFSDIVTFPGKC